LLTLAAVSVDDEPVDSTLLVDVEEDCAVLLVTDDDIVDVDDSIGVIEIASGNIANRIVAGLVAGKMFRAVVL